MLQALEIRLLRRPPVAEPVSRPSTAAQRWRGAAAGPRALSALAGLSGRLHLPLTWRLWGLALCLETS